MKYVIILLLLIGCTPRITSIDGSCKSRDKFYKEKKKRDKKGMRIYRKMRRKRDRLW